MQRAGYIRGRNHNGKRLGVPAFRAPRLERPALFPDAGHTGFDIGGLVILFDHGNAIMEQAEALPRGMIRLPRAAKGIDWGFKALDRVRTTPRKPSGGAKSTRQAPQSAQ